jgi:hypothetical protein
VGRVFRPERGSDHTGTQRRKLRPSFSIEADVGSQSLATRAQVSAESVGTDQKTVVQLERETGIEPATFSLGSGRGHVFSETYPALFEIHEPIETAICEAAEKFGPNLDQGFSRLSDCASRPSSTMEWANLERL